MKNSKIEWCDHTFNPWIGCTKVSPACDNCYASVSTPSRTMGIKWGTGQPRHRTSIANWKQPIAWNHEAERLGIRPRVFCSSLADVFDNEVPLEWQRDLFSLIELTPNLDWLLLTKRIGNVPKIISKARTHDWLAGRENVWLGITVCNQEEADRDIPKLLQVPAIKRFLSMEPLLGTVSISEFHKEEDGGTFSLWINNIDWVIVGGESGSNARPMQPDWVRNLRNQCLCADVPFFFKQWGEFAENWLNDNDGVKIRGSEWIDRVGKKNAGRLLDSREWNEVPA